MLILTIANYGARAFGCLLAADFVTGLLQSASHHATHHKSPYAVRFCTMTELLNPILDAARFWRTLEAAAIRLGAGVQRASAARSGY